MLSAAGCSRSGSTLPRAAVSGVVTIDGRPLPRGMVRFIPTDDARGPKTAVPVTVGLFSVDAEHGPVVGRHRIEIESTDDGGIAFDDETALQQLKARSASAPRVLRVPPEFNVRSRLTVSVTDAGSNEFQFAITTEARRRTTAAAR